MKTKHVMLLPSGELYGHFPRDGKRIAGKADRLQTDLSFPGIAKEAQTREWTHVWCYGDWFQSSDIKQEIAEWEEAGYVLMPSWQETHTQAQTVRVLRTMYMYQKIQGKYTRGFYITYLNQGENKKTWPFYDPQKSNPCEFLDCIDELERLLGIPLGSTPASSGLKLLEHLWSKDIHAHVLKKPANLNLAESPFKFAQQRPLIWQRELTRAEQNQPYLYGYDKNSAFPRSAQNTKVGVGDVIHLTENITFDHAIPGIWRVTMLDPRWQEERIYTYEERKIQSFFDTGMIDMPFWGKGKNIWLGTALIKYMYKQGFNFRIEEAYTFDKKLAKYVYRPLIDLCWELRGRYPEKSPLNLTFKAIMNSIVGVIRSSHLSTDSAHYRPHHSADILADARALMLINICKYAIEGYTPFMSATDALFYMCGPEGVPGMLDHATSLGGYKLILRVAVTESLLTILNARKESMSMNEKLTYIKWMQSQQKEQEHGL